jgi:hypothetical protein
MIRHNSRQAMSIFLIAATVILAAIAVLTWSFHRRAKLDFVHYPDREIDMCARCLHEYQSVELLKELKNLDRAARMQITLPEDYWKRFCFDALRDKLKVKYAEAGVNSFLQMVERRS